MVPWTHWREPRLGRLLTDLTSEFTVFNLVIRLSKVKQSAFFRVSHRRSMCWTTCRCAWLLPLFRRVRLLLQAVKPLFFPTLLERQIAITATWQGPRTCFRYGSSSFWYFRWGQPVVHLINELASRPCPIWVERSRSLKGVTHDLCIEGLNPFWLVLFLIN